MFFLILFQGQGSLLLMDKQKTSDLSAAAALMDKQRISNVFTSLITPAIAKWTSIKKCMRLLDRISFDLLIT